MNYFKFYGITEAFIVDLKALKKLFYLKSRESHPDFHSLGSEEEKAASLDLTTYNNKAYKTLSNFDSRMQYILQLHDVLEEGGKDQLPQSFLMEMMDINEALMEIEMNPSEEQLNEMKTKISSLESSIYKEVEGIVKNYDPAATSRTDFNSIKEFYLKKKYLKRISEKLEN